MLLSRFGMRHSDSTDSSEGRLILLKNRINTVELWQLQTHDGHGEAGRHVQGLNVPSGISRTADVGHS